jgi:alanine racemase
MIKADAYGHGAEILLDALSNFQSDDLEAPAIDAVGVASLDEAIALPETLLDVIVFRPIENTFVGRQRSKLEEAIRRGWTITLCAPAAADDVARVAVACGKRASVQVMVDTGMTRCGAMPERLRDILAKLARHASLRLAGVCTHFSRSEEADGDVTEEQLAHFRTATDSLANGKPLLRSAANSGAVFFSRDSHFDMVRPGISIYGIDPTCRASMDRKLRPALKWTAPLIAIHDVAEGATVGYGQTWRASRATRIGLVPVGYADGYLRCFSNRAMMLAHGRPVPVVGRVSMDLTTLDLGDVPQATVGDEITVLDSDPLSPCSAYALARLADTIPYEIFCRIGPRVTHVAVQPEDLAGGTKEKPASWPIADSTSADGFA